MPQVKTNYGSKLENLHCGSTVGLLIDEESRLHLYINGSDQGIAATDLPLYVYAIIDLYGQCEQVSIFGFAFENLNTNNCANNSTVIERASSDVEDFENSREKADLECHEKENIVPLIASNLSLNIPIQSTANLNLVDNMPHSSNNNSNLPNNSLQNNVMASSIHSDSNNSDSYSEINNDHVEHLKSKHRNDDNTLNGVDSNNQESDNSRQVSNDVENCSHSLNLIPRNECTNVEINNATNINIKNGSAMSTSNMSNLNTAINSTNANNAINESIASNSQNNQVNQDNNSPCLMNGTQNNQFACNNSSDNLQNNMMSESLVNVSNGQDLQLNLNRHYQIFNNCFANSVISNQNILTQNVLYNAPLVASLPSTPLGSLISSSKKCEYLKACTRLKKSLVLPDEFFSLDEILCYCHSCYKVDGDDVICKKGEPLAEFAVPIGWTRFPLKQSINANQIPQSTTEKWHVAFYGTRLDAVRLVYFIFN